VTGPTGAGKELVARELHRLSGRAGPLVPVNCAALPPDLVESEVFGHAAGAFSGARRERAGLVRAAEGGTLFLDEIGEMPAGLQAKLLRFLESGEVRPVGSDRARVADVRVIAATLRDPSEDPGRLRDDLVARLAAWRIHVPPLRERRADVLPIALGLLPPGVLLSADAIEALLLHSWPGNVRELGFVIRRATTGAEPGDVLSPADLALEATSTSGPETRPGPTRAGDRRPDRADLEHALAATSGNVAEAARRLGLHRTQLYRWLDEDGIDPARFRAPTLRQDPMSRDADV
jgi:DNA-binding NtrC family response regulator